jgi:hypothetical protein
MKIERILVVGVLTMILFSSCFGGSGRSMSAGGEVVGVSGETF